MLIKAIMENKVNILYFSDPLCSYCWGSELILRTIKDEFRDLISVEYRMGGLMPDWSMFDGKEEGPALVANHWVEASHHIGFQIDGDVWREDPPASSYPPSIAFRAAVLQGEDKGLRFYNIMREGFFHRKVNIARRENLLKAAAKAKLDIEVFTNDLEGRGKDEFEKDLKLAASLEVDLFPTYIFSNASGKRIRLAGFIGFDQLSRTIKDLLDSK